MTKLPEAELCHFGLYAHDLNKMVDFYTRAFGLVVTDRGRSGRGFDIAFLSGHPGEHHQLAIAAGRPAAALASVASGQRGEIV
jgi:catechol 2,3-dioxygenase